MGALAPKQIIKKLDLLAQLEFDYKRYLGITLANNIYKKLSNNFYQEDNRERDRLRWGMRESASYVFWLISLSFYIYIFYIMSQML